MFDDDFLESLPDNPIAAGRELIEHFNNFTNTIENEDHYIKEHENYLQALGIFQAFCEAYGLEYTPIKLEGKRIETILAIVDFVRGIENRLLPDISKFAFDNTKDIFLKKFGKIFVYRFSDGDVKKIQSLVNQLRDQISKSTLFDENHKGRLLRKLEALQKEIHKSMSNLDRFWGLIGDAGVLLGKFGKDSKPFVDRMREIMQIVWRAQSITEELPSDSPLPMLDEGSQNVDLSTD